MILLITVGTTSFKELVTYCTTNKDFISICKSKFNKITIQHGETKVVAPFANCFSYVSDLQPFINEADVIITHGGAGTLLECLKADKRVIAVTNPKLQDNHQVELVEKWASRNYLIHCKSVTTLTTEITSKKRLTKRPKVNNKIELPFY